jgi:hypothetical protein
MEKISWNDWVRNEEVLNEGNKRRDILNIKKEERLTELITSCTGTTV